MANRQDAIPNELYDGFMQEIAALTPKQQRKWKGTSTTKTGTHTRLRYSNGKLESYSARVHTWVPCVCLSDLPDPAEWVPQTWEGVAATVEASTGIEGLTERALQRAMSENQTGNHYRNHTIKVPTAAGEPVRG